MLACFDNNIVLTEGRPQSQGPENKKKSSITVQIALQLHVWWLTKHLLNSNAQY
jgi:hypothetical protein